jgi:hypothetical protein
MLWCTPLLAPQVPVQFRRGRDLDCSGLTQRRSVRLYNVGGRVLQLSTCSQGRCRCPRCPALSSASPSSPVQRSRRCPARPYPRCTPCFRRRHAHAHMDVRPRTHRLCSTRSTAGSTTSADTRTASSAMSSTPSSARTCVVRPCIGGGGMLTALSEHGLLEELRSRGRGL